MTQNVAVTFLNLVLMLSDGQAMFVRFSRTVCFFFTLQYLSYAQYRSVLVFFQASR